MTTTVTVPIETRYYQFDQQGVAFNMWYLAYMEDARNGYLAERGFSLQDLLASGHDIQVVHTEIDWKQAFRYGDELTIDVTPGRVGNTSFSLFFSMVVGGTVTATACTVYVIVDSAIAGKASVPKGLRAALSG